MIYGYIFGVIDTDKRIVGYIFAGACDDVPPIIEYSSSPTAYLHYKEIKEPLYFDLEKGIVSGNQDLSPNAAGELKNLYKTQAVQIDEQWSNFQKFAKSNIASDVMFPKSETADVSLKAASTQTRLKMDTSDQEWLTLCSFTVMTMWFDAVGRRTDPGLLGSKRPHSILLNKELHSFTGCNPNYTKIRNSMKDWANKNKKSPYLNFTTYSLNQQDNIAAATVFNKHKEMIDKNIPTLVGWPGHVTMGIGYTSDSYYVVRDTDTFDGKPMDTYYYNPSGRPYIVSGLTWSNSSASTAWGKVTLHPGDKNFSVKQLKYMLNALFYTPGSLNDETYDNTTQTAVKQFQKDHGLTADGIVGSGTYKKLMTAHIMKFDGYTANWRVLKEGKKGDDVAQLQLRLYKIGLLPVNAECDGIYGATTKQAVIDFQKREKLTADGIVGSGTFQRLYGSPVNNAGRQYKPCKVCYPG